MPDKVGVQFQPWHLGGLWPVRGTSLIFGSAGVCVATLSVLWS